MIQRICKTLYNTYTQQKQQQYQTPPKKKDSTFEEVLNEMRKKYDNNANSNSDK